MRYGSLAIVSAAALSALAGKAPAQYYEYTVMAKVGDAELTGMGDGPSITRGYGAEPRIAFIGQMNYAEDKWEGVFYGDGNELKNVTPGYTTSEINFAPSCQMNEMGDVVTRWASPNDNGPTYTHIWTWYTGGIDDGTKVADSAAQNPFRAINPDTTINDLGKLVWSGLDKDVKKILATGTWGSYNTAPLVTTPVRPMLSESSEVVLRKGISKTDPIVLLDPLFNPLKTIASSPDFSMLGQSAGICGESDVIVFAGDLSSAGASALNGSQGNWDYGDGKLKLQPLTPGPGIFASVKTSIGRVVVRIAGVAGNDVLDPGETFVDLNGNGMFDPQSEEDEGPCASFAFPDARVAVDGQPADQRAVTVCYMAQNAQGKQGLYTNRLNYMGNGVSEFNFAKPGFLVVGQTTTVIEAGKTIPGLPGAVQSIGVYDQLSSRDRGDVGFYAKTDSSAGIVLARPVQVVFLDFNPAQNYQPGIESAGLFEDLGCDVAWAGNIDLVFSTLAPNRDDLNSPDALNAIQNGICTVVQDDYDHMVAQGGVGVNVKVIGRVGEPAPTGGPYIHVSIGDGPNSDVNDSGICGIATLDLFNQACTMGPGGKGFVSYTSSPLILVDNLFREPRVFSNGDPDNLQEIPISDTGPHKITQSQVIYAISNVTAHEIGHTLGLNHIDDELGDLIMNTKIDSLFSGSPTDEARYRMYFGNNPEDLEPKEGWTEVQYSALQLASSVGADANEILFERALPPLEVLTKDDRVLWSAFPDLDTPVSVASAGLGIIRHGRYDGAPIFVNLGGGDLETLLSAEFEFTPGDAVILIASTDGNGIDVFGVKAGFGGDIESIDVSNGILVMSDERLRSPIVGNEGQPLAQVLDIYQDKPNGQRVKIGDMGDGGGNAGPQAKNDSAAGDASEAIVISVLANDSDPDGLDASSVTVVSDGSHGSANADPATGKVTYRSEANFNGVDTFRYTVRDTKGAPSNEATVTVTIAGGGECYADFDGSGVLDLFDFLAFTNAFNAKDQKADCVDDNTFDLFDFLCFVNKFNEGC